MFKRIRNAISQAEKAYNRVFKADSWYNPTNLFGSNSENTQSTSFVGNNILSFAQLNDLYSESWLARRVIDAPAEDIFKNKISFVHNESTLKNVELLEEELERFEVFERLIELEKLAALKGGALAIFAHEDGGLLSDPLNENSVKRLRWVKVADRQRAQPVKWYSDPQGEKFGEVELYQVTVTNNGFSNTFTVHESRVIKSTGDFLPEEQRNLVQGYGASRLQSCYEALRQVGIAYQSGAETLEDFVYKTFTMADLGNLNALDDEDRKVIKERIRLAAQKTTHWNLAVVGDGENITKHGTPITGFPEMIERFQENFIGASRIPKSRLYGSESGSLGGASASEDTKTYYSWIKSLQEKKIRKQLNKCFYFLSLGGDFDVSEIDFIFPELQEESKLEYQQRKKMQAEEDAIKISSGVMTAFDVAFSRHSKPTIDFDTYLIDDFESLKDDPEEELEEEVEPEKREPEEIELEPEAEK